MSPYVCSGVIARSSKLYVICLLESLAISLFTYGFNACYAYWLGKLNGALPPCIVRPPVIKTNKTFNIVASYVLCKKQKCKL